MDEVPYFFGFVALAVLYVLGGVVAGAWNPLKLARGEDGKTSTSKLQFVLWTAVVAYSYAALYADRVDAGDLTALNDIPQNLLIAMGLTVVTLAGAKGITVSYTNSGRLIQPESEGTAGALVNDTGQPDLVKTQMLLWTFIAIAAYLINVGDHIAKDELEQMPDIDAALMVLMGLGQGAYLGTKLVSTTTPQLASLDPGDAAAGTSVTLAGTAIGTTGSGTNVTMDGRAIPATSTADTVDSPITFTIPGAHPTRGAWPADGMIVEIGVVANGTKSANTKPLRVTPAS